MSFSGRYRRKERIAGRSIAGESFLIPVCGTPAEMENIYVMNPLADFIWQRLDGERTLEGILAEIVDNFDVEREQARGDMSELIAGLLEHDLIEEMA